MWSCIEHPESKEHDEAALIILTKLEPPDYFSSHLDELRNMSHKYLSEGLISFQDWEDLMIWAIPDNKKDVHMDPFPCGLKPKLSKVVFICISVGVAIIVVALLNRDLFKGRRRRVEPQCEAVTVRDPPTAELGV